MILVNVSEILWSAEKRRNTAIFLGLLERAAEFEEGVWIGPAQFLGRGSGMRARLHALREGLSMEEVAPRVWNLLPTYALPRGMRINARIFVQVLRRHLRGRRFCLWINNVDEGSFSIAKGLVGEAHRVVVDLSDDWTTFASPDPPARDARIAEALGWAHAVLAVNEHVHAKFPHKHSRVFRNATDFANFQRRDPAYRLGDVLPKKPGTKIVGFHGGLNVGRVDEELLDKLLDRLPDATFLFVGYSNAPAMVERLSKRPNVVILPAVPFRDLPNVIKSFDVAIIPHAVNEHTRGNDLLKVNDYLASGVPVVSTDCSNVRRHGEAVTVTTTHDEFVAKVVGYLDGTPHDPGPGLAAAKAASWDVAVPELADWLKKAFE